MIVLKYSVIVPVYNTEKYLDRCVSSIVSQNFDDYELILVDDGSPDACPMLCDRWAERDEHIKVIHQENGGLPAARNSGLNMAVGDYILFVDSDDYVTEDYFEKFEREDLPSGWLIYTNCVLNSNGIQHQNIKNLNANEPYFDTLKYLLYSRVLNGSCTKKYSRTIIENCQLRFEDMVPAEDFIFSLQYALHCKTIIVCDESVYVNDQRGDNSITRSRKYGLIDVYPKIFDRAFELVEHSKLTAKQKKQLYLILDKLHVDSFGTCVMEELKDTNTSAMEIQKRIRVLCKKFYEQYPCKYGYKNFIHFCMRVCIRFRFSVALYYLGKLYVKIRK